MSHVSQEAFQQLQRQLNEAQAQLSELREQDRYFRSILQTAGDGFVVLDLQATIVDVNDAYCRMTGYHRDELIGKTISDMDELDDPEMVSARIHEIRVRGHGIFETMHRGKDGRLVPVEVSANFVSESGGRLISFCRDLTERKRTEADLRETSIRLLEAVRAANVGLWDWDLKTNKVSYSREWKAQIGYEEHEIGNDFSEWQDRVHPDDLKPALDTVRKTLDERRPRYSLEFRFRHKNGSYRWILVQASVFFDGGGRPSRVLGSHIDVTQRRHREQRLGLMARMLDFAPASITIHDTRGQFVYANQTTAWMHGYDDVEEFLSINLHDLDVPESEAISAERFRQIEEEGEARFEVAHFHKDGHAFPLEVLAKKTEWNGEPAVLSIAADITDRKRAEQALQESERRFQDMLSVLPDMISIHDSDMNILYSNWQGYASVPAEKRRRNTKCYKTYRGFDEICPDCQAREVLETRKPIQKDVRLPDGTWVDLRVIPFVDDAGEVEMFMEWVRDVTEQKQAQEKQRKMEEQLAQAQKLESVGRLAGGVAHDFNNMLGAILCYAELALDQLHNTHTLRGYLEEIQKAGVRSSELTRQLLAFARKQTIAPKVLDLNKTVTETLNMLRRLIGEDVELEWRPGSPMWPVKMDPSQVGQVLANLCVNARDAIVGTGKVTIETRVITCDESTCAENVDAVPGEYVQLRVSDSGCGMDADTQKHIFEPFFTTKGVGQGTGLGLATVYGIVKQNDGFITVQSKVGQGSCFTVHFPRHTIPCEIAGNELAPCELERGDETILLVEDEKAILDAVKAMLERLGYRVLTASTPGEAIREARDHEGSIHLLMTDVIMPEMNGRELARHLQSGNPGLRSLFMSGYTANVIAHHGVLNEGVCFIQKPFTRLELASKVRRALAGTL